MASNKPVFTISNLYETKILQSKVTIKPHEMNVLDINNLLLKKLISKIGKYCISDGIVNTDTIEILSHSLGEMYNFDTSGTIHYIIKYSADVCKPKQGQILKCIVDEHTDTQTICYIGDESSSPLEIYLNKQNYIGNREYATLKKGDTVIVRVVICNVDIAHDKIATIGEFLQKA